jgi:hypothetical protein
MSVASPSVMPRDAARIDDFVLAALLLVIGLPRAILAGVYDRPLGVEGTLSLVCVGLGLAVLFRRIRN